MITSLWLEEAYQKARTTAHQVAQGRIIDGQRRTIRRQAWSSSSPPCGCCSIGSSPAKVVPVNPASAVRGPKHVVKTGRTPVLDAPDWRKRKLLDLTETMHDLRDRALIAAADAQSEDAPRDLRCY